jgi:hypothetical protein
MSESYPMLNKNIPFFLQLMWSVNLRRAFWNVSFSRLALFRPGAPPFSRIILRQTKSRQTPIIAPTRWADTRSYSPAWH